MDAPIVGIDQLEDSVNVGGFQLAELPILEDQIHRGVVAAQTLQHLGVYRKAGLGLAPALQLELTEQHIPKLFSGIDVELMPDRGVNLLFERPRLLVQL